MFHFTANTKGIRAFILCLIVLATCLTIIAAAMNAATNEQYISATSIKHFEHELLCENPYEQNISQTVPENTSTNNDELESISNSNPNSNEGKTQREQAIDKLMVTAKSLIGVPYVWLGVYPDDEGMDCASFTWYCYSQLGIDIGFETYDQMNVGYEIKSLANAKPGDIILMYYGIAPNYDPQLPEHVALYAGGGMIYEEPQAGGACQYVSFWSKHTTKIQIRRIIAD